MRVGLIGRTRWLLDTGEKLLAKQIPISFILHGQAATHDETNSGAFKTLADKAKCPLYQAKTIDETLLSKLKDQKADIVLSVNWAFILGQNVIDAFPKGIVNAHAGDLPRYRGNACPNWAILNNENNVGLCMQMMTPDEIDAGPVVLRDTYDLNQNTYIADIYEWLDTRIPEMLVEAGEGILNGTLIPTPQDTAPEKSLRCFARRPGDAEIFWNNPAAEIHRLIRASGHPFSGAFTHYEGTHKLIIHKASLYEYPSPFLAVSGQILNVDEHKPVIACGNKDALRLDKAEWAETSPSDAAQDPLNYLGKHMRGRLFS